MTKKQKNSGFRRHQSSPPRPAVKKKQQISNSRPHDSSSKIIFGNAELCSQFLRNYMDMPILKNVKAEDIEDVTERYIPMFTEERNSDTVKRIKISENNVLFFVSLIEHKTKVDYNVNIKRTPMATALRIHCAERTRAMQLVCMCASILAPYLP